MSDVKKGFNVTVGVLFALFFVFIVLPMGMCGGCIMLGAGANEAAKQERAAEVERLGPEIEIKDIGFKINTANQFMHKAAWKFTVKNNRDQPTARNFKIIFQDKDGLEVSKDHLFGETIPAGGERTFTGTDLLQPEESVAVTNMLVEER